MDPSDDPNVIELRRLEKQHGEELKTFRRSSATWQIAQSLAEELERQKDMLYENLQKTYAKIQFLRGMLDSEKQARIN